MSPDPIKVLIVDDSVLMRQVLAGIISRDPGLTVIGEARDGVEALAVASNQKPDVITLDVEMPRMDGLTCLGKIMEQCPVPVIMVSALTLEGAETTLKALELGAVDFVPKPAGGPHDFEASAQELIAKVHMASSVDLEHLRPAHGLRTEMEGRGLASFELVVVGTSTGGPRALQVLLESLPSPFNPPIIIAQHMPAGFTKALAQRLNTTTAMNVKEAEDGEPIKRGWCYVSPAGLQTLVKRSPDGLSVQCLSMEGQIYRPCVDLLFQSAAEACGDKLAAVLMTGMGADGARGMLAIRQAGGVTLAESEDTCVVYGMPRSAVELGAVQRKLPLHQLGYGLVAMMETSSNNIGI